MLRFFDNVVLHLLCHTPTHLFSGRDKIFEIKLRKIMVAFAFRLHGLFPQICAVPFLVHRAPETFIPTLFEVSLRSRREVLERLRKALGHIPRQLCPDQNASPSKRVRL
jgi:hypothetical protein